MKKKDLRKLAILGVSSGLLISNQVCAANPNNNPATTPPKKTNQRISDQQIAFNDDAGSDLSADQQDPNNGNLGYHEMTEDELLLELDSSGVKMYNSLTPEGKALARQVASMRCNRTNACRGLNACQTDNNACAGKGACKGQGKCAVADKNLAVKLVYDKMAQKRNNAAAPKR